MRHLFIINPVSGKTDAGRAMMPGILKAAEACGVVADIEMTKARGHAAELAREAAAGGEALRLYAVGGDGTLNEVLAGAHPFPAAEVACVPCGSGNDFVRTYGAAEDFMDLPGQIRGNATAIDLMAVDPETESGASGICAAITSTGLDAEVAYNIPKYRRIPLLGGSMAYNISILEKMIKPLGKRLRITIDGQTSEGDYLIATVCNARHYGGGYMAAPMASLQDGMLDVILVKKMGRARIASILGKYKKGEHYEGEAIIPALADVMSYHRGREVEIAPAGNEPFILNVDGECAPAPHLYAKVMPGAARFVLPEKLAERLQLS